MCDFVNYLRKGLGDKSRDHTDVQSQNLIAGITDRTYTGLQNKNSCAIDSQNIPRTTQQYYS